MATMAGKKKKTALTVEFKRTVLKHLEDNPLKKKIAIAKEFNIPPTTLATIIKNKDKYDETGGLSKFCKRAKTGEFADVDEAVLKWLKQCRDKNLSIGGPILQEKAQHFAEQLGHNGFRASNGWLEKFKKRNDIVFKKVCGESASVDNTVCENWKEKLPDIVQGFHPDDIYNADETGLFFKCLPDKTMALKGDPCNGGKNSKDRITVLLGANASGNNKLSPLVIGKSKKPRCFKNVTNLPTPYMNNKKAWMNGEAFSAWLKTVNSEMKKKKKKILLFIDNCSAHGTIPKLSNITVHFLPPNTTSKLQPLDQGIIKNFKVNYRKEVVRQFLTDLDRNVPTKINVLDAMWMVTKAWSNVTKKTISNCFKKSGFHVVDPEDDEDDQPLRPAPKDAEVGLAKNWNKVSEVLGLQDMEFEEFVDFDDDVAVCGELTDVDILASVQPSDSEDEAAEDEEEEGAESDRRDPSTKDAREAIDMLKCFFLNKGGLSESVVKAVTDLDCAVDMVTIHGGKQSKIDDFFKL